jgi:signal recognition particle receptor subunit alpha
VFQFLVFNIFVFHAFEAEENKFDVVLVDTAGRMQDNEPLMKALAKVCF